MSEASHGLTSSRPAGDPGPLDPPGVVGGSGGGGFGVPSLTVFAAEAKRSSRESAATEGPVSPFASSYNCRHQSSS
ncbi:hypothetical protein [Streptomyces caniscabiei]|uniref:hypothetical protein n=1 Tax=Streptomyces caniscabiei TaxID=2746961 RepID=UPI0029BC7AD4|nr:hypothetical protein [Streptomyces caniscabiei]MDX3731246.1 hypothetical protein [Streptomyces caniscabiei]